MDRALLLAALAALIAVAPGKPPRHGQGHGQGSRGAATSAEAFEYGAEYEDDDDDEDDAYEDEYASSGEHSVESPGDKTLPGEVDHVAVLGLRLGRHVRHHHFVVSQSGQAERWGWRPDLANKAAGAAVSRSSGVQDGVKEGVQDGSIAPRIVFEETPPGEGCPPPQGGAVAAILRGDARCRAQRCSLDLDCRTQPGQQEDRRCCSNGCVYTCQLVANPPLVVDWEGETPDVLHPEGPEVPLVGLLPRRRPWLRSERSQPLQYNHGAPEVMVLPGGCTLPIGQYQRITAFMKGGGVKKCACSSGAVVCHVN